MSGSCRVALDSSHEDQSPTTSFNSLVGDSPVDQHQQPAGVASPSFQNYQQITLTAWGNPACVGDDLNGIGEEFIPIFIDLLEHFPVSDMGGC